MHAIQPFFEGEPVHMGHIDCGVWRLVMAWQLVNCCPPACPCAHAPPKPCPCACRLRTGCPKPPCWGQQWRCAGSCQLATQMWCPTCRWSVPPPSECPRQSAHAECGAGRVHTVASMCALCHAAFCTFCREKCTSCCLFSARYCHPLPAPPACRALHQTLEDAVRSCAAEAAGAESLLLAAECLRVSAGRSC